MAAGDHLFVSYGIFTHHGIDVGDGTVVELSKKKGGVCHISFTDFWHGCEVSIREYENSDPPSVVLTRAFSRIGDTGYSLFSNNCEHFATWCKTGHLESAQVRTVVRRVTAIAAKGAAKESTRVLAKGASKLGTRAIGRVATPWLLAPDVAQLGVEVVAANMGAHPDTAKTLGCATGLLGTAGVGAAFGGPAGAAIGCVVWFLGEVIGSFVAD